jgi:hypothetical protein
MSLWVTAFCRKSVAGVQPEEMHAAIAARLEELTLLILPENEEEPDELLKRLRVEDDSNRNEFQNFAIYYRKDDRPIPACRWEREQARNEGLEWLEKFADGNEPEAELIRAVLANVTDSVAIELKLSDIQGMGWPVAIGAAVWLAEIGEGVVHATDCGWFVPDNGGARLLLPDD